jgi:hypothetical protein
MVPSKRGLLFNVNPQFAAEVEKLILRALQQRYLQLHGTELDFDM